MSDTARNIIYVNFNFIKSYFNCPLHLILYLKTDSLNFLIAEYEMN